jgi:hypothetical protein
MRIFLAAFMIAISTTGIAQEKTNQFVYRYAIRFNPLALLDVVDHNFSVGGEYCFRPQWSVTADLSYIFASAIYVNSKTSGFIIKPAIRYYVTVEKRFYIEMDVFYKQVGYSITDWVGKDCVNGVPAFEEYKQFIYRKQVGGIDVKGGITTNLSRDQKLRLEGYFGFGIRKRSFGVKDDPRACYSSNRLFDADQNLIRHVTGSVPCGLRLVYCFL